MGTKRSLRLLLFCCALSPSPALAAAGAAPRTDLQGRRAGGPGPSGASRLAPALMRGSAVADWSPLGPPGGDVTDVAASTIDPAIVLAGIAPGGGSGGTLYRSVDGGATWSEVPGFAGVSVYDIEFAARGAVYLATQSGVRRSLDGGVTWKAMNLGIGPNQTVFDIALDPAGASTLWAAIGNAFGLQTKNVMRSTDGGFTWIDLTPPLSVSLSGTAIAVDPTDSNTVTAVFGGDFGGGAVWVSRDGGASWSDRSAGLPPNPMRAVVHDGRRLLVGGGQLFGSQFVGLFSSEDLGVSWKPLHAGRQPWPLRVVEDIAVDPADPAIILVATNGTGVYRTTDGGATWKFGVGGTRALAGRSLRFRPGGSSVLLLGTSSLGVFRSGDAGATFGQSSDGISELNLFAIDANPLDPDQIAVAFQGSNNGGVLSTADGGVTWALEQVPPTRYSAVRFAPDGTLYAISSGPSTVAPEGLYRRDRDGTWRALGPDQGPLFESDLAAIRFSSVDPDRILLGGSDFGVAGFEATVWRTLDGGQTWVKQYEAGDSEFVTDLEIVEDGSDQVMIASYNGFSEPQVGGLLRSVDGGASWSRSLTGLPSFMREARLCASPGRPDVFYMSVWLNFTNGSVFRTVDGGASWSPTGWTGDLIVDIACDPVDDQVLHIAQNGRATVLRSEDQGATFVPFATGLESAGAPRALAQAGDRLLLATGRGSHATVK